MARRNAGTRANMSKFAQKWADKWVGDSLTRMENAGVTPTQDHKTILGWLHGNEMGQIASFFLDCVTGKHGNNIHEFYIDTRVSGKPVTTMYSGYVGKRDVNAALRRLQSARKNPAFGDYLAAGRRHLATGLTKAAEEAQRAAERARAAAEREASRRQCDAPTPEQAIRVLAQAVGVAKLNPRHNGSYYAATDSYGDTAYGVGTTAASALRDARQWYEGNVGALSVDRISRARYLAIKGGNPKASGTRRNPLPAGWTFTESAGDIFVYKQGRLFAQYTHGQWVGMLGPEWKIPPSTVLRAITKTRQGAAEAAPTTGMQVSLFGSRKNGFASHPFGWAQVQGGYVVKVSDAQRKPKGTGWGAIETSGTRIGSSAYLDRNGTVYLR